MLLIAHITVAILGLVAATVAAIAPSIVRIRLTYVCSALTLLSGTALIIYAHAGVLHTCMSGVFYLATTFALSAVARQRLHAIE